MKGLATVACAVMACTLILPLILAGVYYRAEEQQAPLVQVQDTAQQILESPKEDEDILTEDKTEQTPDEETDDVVFSDEKDADRFLAPGTDTTAAETEAPETEQVTTAPETTVPETSVPETEAPETSAPETEAPETEPVQIVPPKEDISSVGGAGSDSVKLRVYLHSSKKYETMTLGDYVKGVILAEMPTYFGIEAFKSQAVAARTYTLYKLVNDSNYHASSHGSTGADLCSNSGHCQAFTTYEKCKSKWGKKTADEVWAKVSRAVDETEGLVMLYDNKPIFAAYHACSFKRTESGANAWGLKTPYLASVTSPETELDIVYSTRTFTSASVKKYLKNANKNADFSGDPSTWIGKITYNESGRVATATIGGVSYTGRKIQSLFSLRGSYFKISYNHETDKFTFDVGGWGHGVGLSQYGAYIMEKNGKDYEDILLHYYSGVSIKRHNYK